MVEENRDVALGLLDRKVTVKGPRNISENQNYAYWGDKVRKPRSSF